jgi:hypothetical protein
MRRSRDPHPANSVRSERHHGYESVRQSEVSSDHRQRVTRRLPYADLFNVIYAGPLLSPRTECCRWSRLYWFQPPLCWPPTVVLSQEARAASGSLAQIVVSHVLFILRPHCYFRRRKREVPCIYPSTKAR